MELRFLLNGAPVVVRDPSPVGTLAELLRTAEVGQTGTKISCGEGGCGACTVLLAGPDGAPERTVNACLHPVCELDGTSVTTVEGVGSAATGYNPVQERLVEYNGSQCGYCTPGFVMNMVGLLRENPSPTAQQVEDRFDGNLCRCTGYRAILNAMQSFVGDAPASMAAAGAHPGPVHAALPEVAASASPAPSFGATPYTRDGYSWYRADDLPGLLALLAQLGRPDLGVKLVHGNTSVGIYKRAVEDPRILIDISRIASLGETLRSPAGGGIAFGGGVTIAAMLAFLETVIAEEPAARTEGLRALHTHALRIANHQVRAVATMAGNLVLATGHARSAEPFPSDLFLVLATLGAEVTVARPDAAERQYAMLDLPGPDAFPHGFVITRIRVPFTADGEIVRTYKVARRTQNAHAIVNAGFRISCDASHRVVAARIVYGGIAAMPLSLDGVAAWLVGRTWDVPLLGALPAQVEAALAPRLIPMPATGVGDTYRLALAVNLSRRAWVAFALAANPAVVPPNLASAGADFDRPVSKGQDGFMDAPYHDSEAHLALAAMAAPAHLARPAAERTRWASDVRAARAIVRQVPSAPSQPAAGDVPLDVALPKIGAILQASGEARYTQDLSGPPQTVQGWYVLSARANATFDHGAGGLAALGDALRTAVPGVVGYVTYADIPDPAKSDAYSDDDPGGYDPVFANARVTAVGQPIGLVLATTTRAAQDGAAWVQARLRYTDVAPAVFTIAEALAVPEGKGILSGQGSTPVLTRPGGDKAWLDHPVAEPGKVFVHGSMETGAQSHFYMEPQVTLAVPGEGKRMDIFSSTQHLAACQESVARHLGWPASAITARAVRLGGGFGGKEVRPPYIASAAAVAANALRRPVRLALDRATDMQLVGTRHPYRGEYCISADRTGRIEKMRIDHWSNAGFSYDASLPIMDLVVFSADGAYQVDTFRATGTVCRTNLQTRTAFRSFGVIQGMLILESAIEHLAHELGMRPEDVRARNFYRDASATNWDTTPFNQALKYCRINQVWKDWGEITRFAEREAAVRAFNAANAWRKRGIAMIPLKYGISYTYRPMNQGGAYVVAMSADGTVILHHGGIEMGQGIHTKMIIIAAQVLGIATTLISVADSATSTIPNASSTGASTGSDLNGGAVKLACAALRARLEAFCRTQSHVKDFPDWEGDWGANWPKIVAAANTARIDLSAESLFDSPDLGELDPATGQLPAGKQLFYYYTYCVAVSEVEIDVLTGESEVRRSDLVYDAGTSIDSLLDFGQIEGGFIQGLGNVTTEQVYYGPDGALLPDGTWNYKPPFNKTIPVELNVAQLQYVRNDHATETPMDHYGIQSSKSTGEPPLVLANSVYFAIRRAIAAVRAERGQRDWFTLDSPATVERIQQAITS